MTISSLDGLFVLTANVYSTVQTSDGLGSYTQTLQLKNQDEPCWSRCVSGNPKYTEFQLKSQIDQKFFFNPDVDVTTADIIRFESVNYEVISVSKARVNTGEVDHLQVLARIIR